MPQKSIAIIAFILFVSACAPAPTQQPTATQVATTLTSEPTGALIATWVAAPEATATTPESLTCLHPEDIATWCANLEAKDPHAMWEMAIDAFVDGPANADYWAETLGKANPTHAEKLNWLKNSTHTDADGNEVGYWLPAQSPDGTDFLWIVDQSGGYAGLKANKVVQEADGVSLQDIPMVVITPENWSAIKGWWRTQIDAQRTSTPISDGTIYSPPETYGWLAVKDEKTGLLEMVFVGGSAYIPDYSIEHKYDKKLIGGNGANAASILAAMWNTLMRATNELTPQDLNLNDPNATNPNMVILAGEFNGAEYPSDPDNFVGESEIFVEVK